MSERQTKAGNQITLSHSLILSLSHSFTLSFTHSQHAEQLLFSCLCSKITLSLSHSNTLTLWYFHTLSMSHSITLDSRLSTCWTSFVFISMLKTRCLLLKIAMVFFDHLSTLSPDIRVSRAGSQLKIIMPSLPGTSMHKCAVTIVQLLQSYYKL